MRPALFGILAEGLADRFEPALCDVYARLFSQAIAAVVGRRRRGAVGRYRRVRRRAPGGEPRRVFVLSRVTLGADVAVTSVLLDAAKQRFPAAPKSSSWGRGRTTSCSPPIRASVMRRRLSPRRPARTPGRARRLEGGCLAAPDSLIIDPDSRLTQLGLLPVCPEDRYHFFESRGYGGETGCRCRSWPPPGPRRPSG